MGWEAFQNNSEKGTNYWRLRIFPGGGDSLAGYCGKDVAFLIASAPELLQILKTIIEVWDEHKIIGPTVYHDARAAIARAEGKPPGE